MKFGPLQLKYFSADEGAYSIVTADERKKGQITLTEADGESDIAIGALGANNIPRQSAQGHPLNVYVRRPDGTEALSQLTINFPKSVGNELRIYRKAVFGFGYNAGDVWFLFRRGKKLLVGAVSEPVWRSLGRVDEEDEEYIALTEEAEKGPVDPKRVTSLQYHRDPVLAVKRFTMAKHQCEVDSQHELFVGRATGNPFVEAHHLVGVSLQKQFPNSNLDCLENIYALCPWCHRAIHHAEPKTVTELIDSLIVKRNAILGRLALSSEDILRLYNCETITK